MKEYNEKKAKLLYDFLDQSQMFKGTVEKKDRSLMNVPFVTGDPDLDALFVKESKAAGLENLKGHPDRRRHESQHLQCDANGRRRKAGNLYGRFRKEKPQIMVIRRRRL